MYLVLSKRTSTSFRMVLGLQSPATFFKASEQQSLSLRYYTGILLPSHSFQAYLSPRPEDIMDPILTFVDLLTTCCCRQCLAYNSHPGRVRKKHKSIPASIFQYYPNHLPFYRCTPSRSAAGTPVIPRLPFPGYSVRIFKAVLMTSKS